MPALYKGTKRKTRSTLSLHNFFKKKLKIYKRIYCIRQTSLNSSPMWHMKLILVTHEENKNPNCQLTLTPGQGSVVLPEKQKETIGTTTFHELQGTELNIDVTPKMPYMHPQGYLPLSVFVVIIDNSYGVMSSLSFI
jgi:hypothetical protein